MNTTTTRGRHREATTRPTWLLPALGALAAVVLLVVLAACTGTTAKLEPATETEPVVTEEPAPAEPVVEPEPEPTPEPVTLQSHDSVFDLRTAVESTGYKCTTWRVVSEPINAIQRAECTDEIVLSIHTDASQAQSSAEDVASIVTGVLGSEAIYLIGPNWSVNCGDDLALCEQFQTALAGEVQVFEPEDDAASEPEPEPESELTASQEQAVGSAKSYLDYSGFSRTGLIGQLEYEGFSEEDAEFAVDYLDVDWMEQAVKVAESYLEYSNFSRSGLIGQLEYEGFTAEQAEHGTTEAGL